MKGIVVCCFLLILSIKLSAQDSTKVDQAKVIIKDSLHVTVPKQKFQPKPQKALLLALALPGAGQIYNRDWWKLPLVYGALAGVGYLVQQNYSEYRRYKTARELLLEGKPHEFSDQNPSESTLKAARDYYRSNFEMSCLGLGVVYILQGIEAYVAAHLKNFDVSEDLGLTPFMGNSPIGPYYGLSIAKPFEKRSKSRISPLY